MVASLFFTWLVSPLLHAGLAHVGLVDSLNFGNIFFGGHLTTITTIIGVVFMVGTWYGNRDEDDPLTVQRRHFVFSKVPAFRHLGIGLIVELKVDWDVLRHRKCL